MIELKNVSKEYKENKRTVLALKDVNLKFEDGEIHGIIGLSGAGKSTLIRCINLLEVPTGEVLIDGEDLLKATKKRVREIRRNIGMIFQNFNLLEQRTALQNVLFPLEIAKVNKSEAILKAKEMLDLVGLKDRENFYPSQLSGGQKQRVAIARALITNPKYLLCDEPTSALDPTTTIQILDLLKYINKTFGITIIIITHEMKVVERICSYVSVISENRIVESGKLVSVMTNPKSEITRNLIVPDMTASVQNSEKCKLRLVFNDFSSNKPIISELAINNNTQVNILFAELKTIEQKSFGHMVIEVDENSLEKTKDYLITKGVYFEVI